MTKLTAENVNKVLMDCLFREGENTDNPVLAAGILTKYGFHRERLENHQSEILEMLMQLPNEFHKDKGGGWSFLNACMTAEGEHWAEHVTIEQLLCLGLATDQAHYMMPREQWATLPGGMPYFCVGPRTTTHVAE